MIPAVPARLAEPFPAADTSQRRAARATIDARIEPLASEWEALGRQLGAAPFLLPGWIGAWWHAFGEGRLEIHGVRRDGRLAALLPVTARGGELRSLTNGHAPLSGALADSPGSARELAHSLLARRPRRVRLASTAAADSAVEAIRQVAMQRGYRPLVRSRCNAPYLEIGGDWSSYERTLSRNLRLDLRRCRRRLESLGRLEIEMHDGARDLDRLLDDCFAVEASGWKGRAGTAIRSAEATSRFYREVARWADERRMLRLFVARLDRRPFAMLYALELEGVWHLLKGGYDPGSARYSPGKLLIREALVAAHATGGRRIELHGAAEPYKLRWTSDVSPRLSHELFSGSPAGTAQWTLLAIVRPAVKRLLRRTSGRSASRSDQRSPIEGGRR